MKLAIIVACALLASGCATPYQASGFRGGYSEVQLADNVFKVSFQGNALISASRVANYTLLRSAELAAEHGFSFFVIVDSKDYETTGSIYQPKTTYASASTSGNQVYGSSTTYGGYATHYSKPSSVNTIFCFREKPEGFSYSTADVIRSLRESYRLD